MTTIKQFEQSLKDRYCGKSYNQYEAQSVCARSVRDLAAPYLNHCPSYIVICKDDHSHNHIRLRDTQSGIECPIVSITVKKKKGATHRIGYGRYGQTYADYTFADFIADPYGQCADIETAIAAAIENLDQRLAHRNDKFIKLKADIDTVKKALGFTENYQVQNWIEDVKIHWYSLHL